jgi:hypothetical protein
MRLLSSLSIWIFPLVATLAVAFGASAQPGGGGGGDPAASRRFEYSRDASTVVIGFAEVVDAIKDADPGPSLSVYGDGRVAVHFPTYMLRAGDYTLRLAPAEMNALVHSMVSRGIAEFEEPAVRRRKADIEAQADVLIETFDAVMTQIELRLERYRPPGNAGPGQPIHKRVAWSALRADAKRHPQITEIQDLAAAHRELWSLMERPDLVKVH